MPIHLELKPEVEERLGRAAQAVGMSVEAYVESLIERQISRSNDRNPRVDLEKLDRVLDALSVGSEDRPAPSPELYTRGSIYREHN